MADDKEALPVVAWAIYDSQGFYEASLDNESAIRFCAHYNRRAVDPLQPYTYGPLTDHATATAALSELRAEVERLTLKLQTVEREASEYYRRGPKIGSVLMRHELHDEVLQIISHGISSGGAVVIIVASNKQGAARSNSPVGADQGSAEGGV